MRSDDEDELILSLWGKYDSRSADLVNAKRRCREGLASGQEVEYFRNKLREVACDLAQYGEYPANREPGEEPGEYKPVIT